MSTLLLRQLLTAGITANLTKNEWRCYATMLIQTIGYDRKSNALTTKRVAMDSAVRFDRAEKAIAGLLGKGMMHAEPDSRYDWNYSLPEHFFDATDAPFFAPAVPKNGKTLRKTEGFSEKRIHTENTSLQKENITDKAADATPVCDVNLNSVTEIKKPDAVDMETYTKLLPALRKLPNTKALDVLALLSASIQDGSAKNPERLGGHFIKCAREGTLDTSPLQAKQQAAQADADKAAREAAREAREAAAERAYLLDLAKRGGISPATLGVAA